MILSSKWQSRNENKAISAIENPNNQDEFFKAAMQREHAYFRVSTAKKSMTESSLMKSRKSIQM